MAIIRHFSEIEEIKVEIDGAIGTTKRLLLGSSDGVPLFSMRMFTVEPGGMTPSHRHDFEHEIFVLEGTGVLVTENSRYPMKSGSAVFIPAMEQHHMETAEDSAMRILCLVPKQHE